MYRELYFFLESKFQQLIMIAIFENFIISVVALVSTSNAVPAESVRLVKPSVKKVNTVAQPKKGQKFECPNCKEKFKVRKSFNRHTWKCSGVRFECSKCDATFSRPDGVRRHEQNMH